MTTNDILYKKVDKLEALASGEGGTVHKMVVEGEFEGVYAKRAKGGWQTVERKKRGGQNQRRETRFRVFSDSHGRDLGEFLRGAEVKVKTSLLRNDYTSYI